MYACAPRNRFANAKMSEVTLTHGSKARDDKRMILYIRYVSDFTVYLLK